MPLPAFLGPAMAIPRPAALLAFAQTTTAVGGAAQKSLAFTMQIQVETNWCWAATASSVAAFHGHGALPSQCQVASGCLHLICCSTPTSTPCNVPFFLDQALTFSGNLRAPIVRGALAFGPAVAPATSVVDEIDADHPLGCHISWTGGGGHFNVIFGYDAANQDVDIADPFYGVQTVPLSTFVTSYRGAGSWDFSYLTA